MFVMVVPGSLLNNLTTGVGALSIKLADIPKSKSSISAVNVSAESLNSSFPAAAFQHGTSTSSFHL